ncbi:MAG: hypothetical protein ACKO97_13325, partial [Actinomycetota bacterium]
LEAKFDNRIDNLETKLNTRIDNLETRINELDSRFNSRFDSFETKFDARFDELASMKRYVISTGVALVAVMCGVGAPLWFSLL